MEKTTTSLLDSGAKAELSRIAKAPHVVARDIKTAAELVEHINKLYEKVAKLEKAVATIKVDKSRR
jgi:hypothetical protein